MGGAVGLAYLCNTKTKDMRNKVYMSVALLMGALVVSLVLVVRSKRDLQERYEMAIGNARAYEEQYNGSESSNRVFKLTIDGLRSSRDSVFQELDRARRELKVKDSRLMGLQYVASDFARTDTIVLPGDTVFRDGRVDVDTVLSDEWYSVKVGLRYPSSVIVSPAFKSEKYIVVSARRETVNPPKRFFLLRWFQRKHTVVSVDVIEKNPYVQGQSNRFVEIVR